VQVQDAKEGEGVKQVVLQSGAKVGLCLEKPEDLKINILTSGITSEKNKVTEKFLTVLVSNWQRSNGRNARKFFSMLYEVISHPPLHCLL
jgi:hypothetical protein